MNQQGKSLPWRFAMCLAFLPLALVVGCGSSADVSGKVVTSKGEVVKGGTLVFNPVGGGPPPLATEIQTDGTYKLPAGAQPGRYSVSFTPPPQELTEQQRTNPKYKAPPPLYMNLVPKPAEVEVKSGANTLDLQLVPK